MLGNAAVTRILPLRTPTDEVVIAVLQQPLATALEPFHRLQRQLAWTSLLAVVISILAGVLISRGIARPVRELADSARRIAAGDYSMRATDFEHAGDRRPCDRLPHDAGGHRNARNADHGSRVPRHADRSAEPDALRRPARTPGAGGAGYRHVGRRAADGPRSLQVRQRHARSSDRRPAAREVASRLEGIVNRPGDTVARLGGDEFAILLPGTSVGRCAGASRLRCCGALEAPMTLEGHIVDVRANVGIAVFPEHGHEAATLLRHADVAMYEAKRDERRHRRVRRALRPGQPRPAIADERPQQGGRPRRADAGLSAEGLAARRVRPLRRGAGPLAPPDARPGRAERVHPVRRADRLHPLDHAVGSVARHRAVRGMARRGPADARLDQHLRARRDGRAAAGSGRRAARESRLRGAAGSASRSPRARSSTIRGMRSRTSTGCMRSAARSRSTTTAPAIRRSPTCGGCRCTSSRSTSRSSWA